MAGYEKHLQLLRAEIPNETIIASVFGAYEAKLGNNDTVRNGVMAATDQRVVFYGKKAFGYDFESFPYSNISSIDRGKNLMGKTITLYASGNKVNLKWINKGDIEGFVSAVDARIGKKDEPQQQPKQNHSHDDIPAQIEKLARLRDQGHISEEEFSAKKAQLLDKM